MEANKMKNHVDPKPSRVLPPGVTLQSELAARNISIREFARILGRPQSFVTELVAGRRLLTAETALQLEAALEIPAGYWMNMESGYRLWKQEQDQATSLEAIRGRARAIA